MKRHYSPPRIRRLTGAIGRWLYCDPARGGCGYRSREEVLDAGVAWHGADCPECGRRLHVDATRKY